MDLKGNVSIVTGGANGIGRGIAEAFARAGSSVVIADVDKQRGTQVQAELRQYGVDCLFVTTDVTAEHSVQNMVNTTLNEFGQVDILVNNAGITRFGALTELTVDDWDRLQNIDLKGMFLCSKHTIPIMKLKESGVIINISSNHAMATLPNSEGYSAAKGGVVSMTKSIALSYARNGIRAVAICPGFTDTPHFRNWLQNAPKPSDLERHVRDLHPLGRVVTPADVGELAVFLASSKASMITGTCITIDGGISARLYN